MDHKSTVEPHSLGGFGVSICYALSRALLRRRLIGHSGAHYSGDKVLYQQWRDMELHHHFDTYFSPEDVAGLDVVDFGCGQGALSFYVATLGAKSVIGIEVSVRAYNGALNNATKHKDLLVKPRFILSNDVTVIDLPDSSVDVILCFDVLEHIMAYNQIIREWNRVLRPGGRVLIWWVPWWNPYGSHLQSLIPIPWCHVFFSEPALLDTCARIYDLPEYAPRHWDLDDKGMKKPNSWRGQQELHGLNRLTMHRFEAICREVGLNIDVRKIRGLGSARTLRGWKSWLGKATELFLSIPFLREFITLNVTYYISKPVAASNRGYV